MVASRDAGEPTDKRPTALLGPSMSPAPAAGLLALLAAVAHRAARLAGLCAKGAAAGAGQQAHADDRLATVLLASALGEAAEAVGRQRRHLVLLEGREECARAARALRARRPGSQPEAGAENLRSPNGHAIFAY